MSSYAISSSLEAANWFFCRAEKDNVRLDKTKLLHLIFLAQVHYALKNDMNYLIPAAFIADKNGFIESNLAYILNFGLPLMPAPKFKTEINNFLELIWKKYFPQSNKALADLIKSSASYSENSCIIPLEELANSFNSSINPQNTNKHKILISQNGPVMVSKWQPRKVGPKSAKESKNA